MSSNKEAEDGWIETYVKERKRFAAKIAKQDKKPPAEEETLEPEIACLICFKNPIEE